MRVRSILAWLTSARRDAALPLKNVSLCVNLDQCNLRCIMCWTTYSRGRHHRAEREMNLPRERLLELLRDPSLQALDSICAVGGGEPFLYPWTSPSTETVIESKGSRQPRRGSGPLAAPSAAPAPLAGGALSLIHI